MDTQQMTINVTLDYFGSKDYGKRVFWLEREWHSTFGAYIFASDFPDWFHQMKKHKINVHITNEHEVAPEILKAIG